MGVLVNVIDPDVAGTDAVIFIKFRRTCRC